MATKVAEQIKFCSACHRKTVHYKNSEQISWLMHLVLAIFTCGAWLIIFLFVFLLHPATKLIGDSQWVCSQCGCEEKIKIPDLTILSFALLIIFIIVAIFSGENKTDKTKISPSLEKPTIDQAPKLWPSTGHLEGAADSD
jgi:hypothetical protein